MIRGIGIDAVAIERFAQWHSYSHKQLLRIFSQAELTYCLENSQKSAERFAVRFAAREALWKALCQAMPEHTVSFLALCRSVEVRHGTHGAPYFSINESCVAHKNQILLTLSHTETIATAFVIIQ